MKLAWKSAGALFLVAAACSTESENRLPTAVERVLIDASQLELMTLDPTPLSMTGATPPESDQLHGYAITGRARLTDAQPKTELVDLILRGIRESDGRVAACFNPRHAVRAVNGGKTVELVICFECLSLQAYGDALPGSGTKLNVLVANSVESSVNRIFSSVGLTVGQK